MKTISSDLNTHLAGRSTTIATCWKVTRTDGQIFGFTDHNTDLVVSAVTYKSAIGYTRTAIATNSSLAVDNVDLEAAFDDVSITEIDLLSGLWDYAAVEIFAVNWADLTQGTMKLRKGRLGEVKAGRNAYMSELRGLLQNVQQDIGRVYSPSCDADLGDARCKVVLAGSPTTGFTVESFITAVDSKRVFYDSALTNPTAFFDYGRITFTGGDNNGLSMEVKTFVQGSPQAGQISLFLPMPFVVQVGDTYSMHAGCDKAIATCLNKFNNVVNNRSFPHVPGTDKMVTGGR